MLFNPPRTFATFSEFQLNTSNSANIKVACLFDGHNFPNWWHFKFELEVAEILGQSCYE
jgi:hypothetical protein